MRNSAYKEAAVPKLERALRALADETRLRMLNLLLERECCVCEVMQVLNISQTRASRNLSILFEAGFLKYRKEGLWAYYAIDKAALEDHLALLLEAVETGWKDSPLTLRDKESLQKAKRLGPRYCQTC
jgi:ArsR family transcriptional regulator, arsenate/arsenite/antimonite-responsive transcriptional repressor